MFIYPVLLIELWNSFFSLAILLCVQPPLPADRDCRPLYSCLNTHVNSKTMGCGTLIYVLFAFLVTHRPWLFDSDESGCVKFHTNGLI